MVYLSFNYDFYWIKSICFARPNSIEHLLDRLVDTKRITNKSFKINGIIWKEITIRFLHFGFNDFHYKAFIYQPQYLLLVLVSKSTSIKINDVWVHFLASHIRIHEYIHKHIHMSKLGMAAVFCWCASVIVCIKTNQQNLMMKIILDQ